MSTKIKIYNPITDKETKIDPYGRTAKKIYKYMFDAGADPADILPANLTYNNNRFIRVKPIEDVSNVRRITYAKVIASIGGGDTMPYFKDIMKSYKGQTVKLVKKYSNVTESDIDMDGNPSATTYNVVEQDEIFSIPATGFNKWWSSKSLFFWLDSDEQLFGNWNEAFDDPKLQAQLLILTLDKVNKEQVNQYFLDGINHCFFHPIKEWALDCEDTSKSDTAKKRYKTINNKVTKYIEKYHKGIPEEDLSVVCNDLQISVEIDLPSTMLDKKTKFIEYESQRKPLKKFRFVNTRLNHIELNKLNSKDNYEEVTKDQIMDIFVDCKKRKEFILWKESSSGVTQINTLNQIYKLKDEDSYNEIVKTFEKQYNFSNYKIEKNQNKDLTKFLDDGLNTNQSITFLPKTRWIDPMDIINAYSADMEEYLSMKKDWAETPLPDRDPVQHCVTGDLIEGVWQEQKKIFDWVENLGELNHIDIKKAYTQGHNCSMYQGYLGKITDFRKTDKIVGLGIYKVENIKFNGSALEKMKCFHDHGNYPSPELEFYQSLGITFDIIMGCWGTGFDFEFSQPMYQKQDGLSHYCKWYGCLMRINEKDRYNFNCKKMDYAKLNAYNSDATIRYNYHESAGIIEYDRKYQHHSFHIASFISSYARITLLEQVLKFKDFNQIVSVVVDGIYYRDQVEVGPLFCDKEKKSLYNNINCCEYVANHYNNAKYETIGDFREDNKLEVHLGAGGCGKTHAQLVDKGLVNALFIAPSWRLARNKKSEYGIDSSVFFYLLDQDPDKWGPLMRNYSVFIVDEISMFSNQDKEKLLKRFPEHKIIFCGDIKYQLESINGTEFEIGDLPVFNHTKNYRCKCKILEEKLLFLRKVISKNKNLRINCKSVITKNLKLDIIDSNEIDYSVEDMIITNTNNTKDKYTERYKHLDKYTVLENTKDYSNGEIIIGPKPDNVKCELRHGHTIYASQGTTAEHKLFIDVNKMNSLKLLYTGMSRARTMDQIVFIE